MLYVAWTRGRDPYRLYNCLDEDYRPLDGTAGRFPPPRPSRAQQFEYGCALADLEMQRKRGM